MLKKESKLTAEDLLKLKKEGKRVYSTLFSVTYLIQEESKFAVTVPKKVYKNAVDRNRAKRRVFAVIQGLSPVKSGLYEFFVKSPIDKVNPSDLTKEIKQFYV